MGKWRNWQGEFYNAINVKLSRKRSNWPSTTRKATGKPNQSVAQSANLKSCKQTSTPRQCRQQLILSPRMAYPKRWKDEDDYSRSSLYCQQRQHVDQRSDKREAEAVKRKVRQRSTRGTTDDSRHKFASDSQRKAFKNVLFLIRWLEIQNVRRDSKHFRKIKVYFLLNNVDLRSF